MSDTFEPIHAATLSSAQAEAYGLGPVENAVWKVYASPALDPNYYGRPMPGTEDREYRYRIEKYFVPGE
jgi:hypothetical protein